MTIHQQYIAAVRAAIPDPSPAVAAYIEHYQGFARQDRNTMSDEAFEQYFARAQALWSRLSVAEQAQLRAIQTGMR